MESCPPWPVCGAFRVVVCLVVGSHFHDPLCVEDPRRHIRRGPCRVNHHQKIRVGRYPAMRVRAAVRVCVCDATPKVKRLFADTCSMFCMQSRIVLGRCAEG
jgi:hypothetical protein